jgi:hypothetical protein
MYIDSSLTPTYSSSLSNIWLPVGLYYRLRRILCSFIRLISRIGSRGSRLVSTI